METQYQCKTCGDVVSKRTVEGCWQDKYTPDHFGLCCDCFDVSLGARPPVKLGLKTAPREPEDDDEKII